MDRSYLEQTWVIIPAYNEAAVIGTVLSQVTELGTKVVVVDDCSNDDTAAIASGFPVHVLRHAINLGQGAALQTGLSYALAQGAPYLVTFDADGQHTAESIPALLEPLLAGRADVALGTRFAGGRAPGGIPWQKRLVLRWAIWYTRLTCGLKLSDTHNGLRALTAEAASKLAISQNRMAHASQILEQIRSQRLRYEEVPVRVLYTPYAVHKGQKLSNAINIVWENLLGKLGL